MRIRFITPALARSTSDLNTIPTLPGPVPLSTTLQDLHNRACSHVGLPSALDLLDLECNCNLARKIESNAIQFQHTSDEASSILVVVYDNNRIAAVTLPSPTLSCIQDTVRLRLRDHVEGKQITPCGGDEISEGSDGKQYVRLPVVAVCSRARHEKCELPAMTSGLDLHSAECSIEITTHNAEIPLSSTGLADCAIDGVLNLYLVQRNTSHITLRSKLSGQDERFSFHSSWDTLVPQSERGLANFLSTLRVFSYLVSKKNMEEEQQDAFLHVMYVLTRFPPAVRATHILMRDEKLQLSE